MRLQLIRMENSSEAIKNYYLVETKTLDGYELDQTEHEIVFGEPEQKQPCWQGSFGRWSAGTGIFSNGTSGTGSLTRYGTKPFTDGRCVCLRALMNAWLRKNGMKRSIRRLGAFQRYKGGVSCSTTSMSSIFTKSPLWSIAPLRQYRNLLRLQRRK